MRVRLIVSAALAAAATYSAIIREAAPTLSRRPHGAGGEDAGPPPEPDTLVAAGRITHANPGPDAGPAPVAEAVAPTVARGRTASDRAEDDPISVLARQMRERGVADRAPDVHVHAHEDVMAESPWIRRRTPAATAATADGADIRDAGPVAIAEREETRGTVASGRGGATVDRLTEGRTSPFTSRVRDLTRMTDPAAPVATPAATGGDEGDAIPTTPVARTAATPPCALIDRVAARRGRPSPPPTGPAPVVLIGSRPARRPRTEEPTMTTSVATPIPAPLTQGRFSLRAVAASAGDMTLTAVTFDRPIDATLPVDAIDLAVDSATNMARGGLRVLDGRGFAPDEDGFALMLTADAPGPFAVTGTYRVSA